MKISDELDNTRQATLAPGPLPLPGSNRPGRAQRPPQAPTAFIAQALIAPTLAAGRSGLLYLASSERRADEIARCLRGFAPEIEVVSLPPWDCLPYDRSSPSRECMGRRMAALAVWLMGDHNARALIVSPEALLQRLPPTKVIMASRLRIATGAPLDRAGLERFAKSAGYVFDDRIDEPGEIAILGEVVDIYPACADGPVRVRLAEDGAVAEISRFDPLTQRSGEPLGEVWIGPASELILPPDAERAVGQEHLAPAIYGAAMRAVLALAPDAAVAEDPYARERMREVETQIKEAFQSHRTLSANETLAPSKLYLSAKAVIAGLGRRTRVAVEAAKIEVAPNFALSPNPGRAFSTYVDTGLAAGRKVILTGLAHERRALEGALARRSGRRAQDLSTWAEAMAAPPSEVIWLPADLEAGFEHPELIVIAASDVLGGRMAAQQRSGSDGLIAAPDLRIGDSVIHEDHGLGVLAGLERLDVAGEQREALRLTYRGEASLLAAVEDLGRIWRYGAEADAISLDRLHTDAWAKRRAALSQDVDATASHLVALAKARREAKAPRLAPPKTKYARFAARFPYPETADQAAAIEAVLEDLASGQVMRRLVCGDVGFGKTEVALRAAAAAAFSGRQVALIAPTTVLARQHFETFRRRFSDTGVKVAQLSRLVSAAEAKTVKAGLADGSIDVVIGTHALAATGIAFDELGLLIIDEEQRFGAKLKADLAELGPAVHRLTLTATPIPRTLQLAMVGVEDVSVIATPPARRRPIRTFLAPYDGASVRTALMREQRRGGQSFVVVPRISDIGPMTEELARLCPELKVLLAHGELPADEVDETMVRFSAGEGDVLLATNIIESGLDVPRANTMLVWRADLFGLSQLHQLRGRVGRGRVQGVTYLFHDPDAPLPEVARARLGTLEAFDRLGSGLAISAQDLEIRGAGDLSGDTQAGHVKLIGTALYQRLLAAAVRAASGEPTGLVAPPELNIGLQGHIPSAYVPDDNVRINLYARLAHLERAEQVIDFAAELEDRFGPLPVEVEHLLEAAQIRTLAQALGIVRIDAGPKGVRLSFLGKPPSPAFKGFQGLEVTSERMIWRRPLAEAGLVEDVRGLLEALAEQQGV